MTHKPATAPTRVTSTSAVINGRQVHPGTRISVQGTPGRYVFVCHTLTEAEESYTLFGGTGYKPDLPPAKQTGHAQYRSFLATRKFTVHKETK